MQVGSFADIIFETSSKRLLTLDGLEISKSANYAEHAIIQNKPKLEFTGVNLNEVSFEIQLNKKLGVDPVEIQELIDEYLIDAVSSHLIIGNKVIGEFVILSAKELWRHIIDGTPAVVSVSISMKEYN